MIFSLITPARLINRDLALSNVLLFINLFGIPPTMSVEVVSTTAYSLSFCPVSDMSFDEHHTSHLQTCLLALRTASLRIWRRQKLFFRLSLGGPQQQRSFECATHAVTANAQHFPATMAAVHEERFIPERQKLDQLSLVKDYATIPRLEYR